MAVLLVPVAPGAIEKPLTPGEKFMRGVGTLAGKWPMITDEEWAESDCDQGIRSSREIPAGGCLRFLPRRREEREEEIQNLPQMKNQMHSDGMWSISVHLISICGYFFFALFAPSRFS